VAWAAEIQLDGLGEGDVGEVSEPVVPDVEEELVAEVRHGRRRRPVGMGLGGVVPWWWWRWCGGRCSVTCDCEAWRPRLVSVLGLVTPRAQHVVHDTPSYSVYVNSEYAFK